MGDVVILVDNNDVPLGVMDKMEAHERGVLHRAFSVFLYNSVGELMLQRRALSKYHSGGLWTNTCCSHPRPGESVLEAGRRRLGEEMGMSANLSEAFSFIYEAELDNGLTEHELDHVLIGQAEEQPVINPDEVAEWKFMHPDEVRADMAQHPEKYTAWFRICFEEVESRRGPMLVAS